MALHHDNSDGSHILVANHADLNPNNITMAVYMYPLDNFPNNKPIWFMCKHYTSHSNPYYQYGMKIADYEVNPKYLSMELTVGGTRYNTKVINSGWTYNAWNWVFVTYDNETIRLYLNAIEKLTDATPSGNISAYDTPLILGGYKPAGTTGEGDAFEGYIADYRIYNRALSVPEIQAIVGSNGGDGIVNGLMGRWLANERHDGATASADGTEAETIAPANLISHWLMNDNLATTNVLDNKGGNDGTAQQNTEDLHTTGKINGALTSNGSTDKINCGNGILTSNNQDFSVLFWAYRNGNAYEGLVSKDPDGGTNRNWFLASNTNYSIKIRVYETDGGSLESVSGTNTFPLSTWTQIGLIVDYTNTKLYLILNGVRTDITGAWDGTSKNAAIDFIIGWFYSDSYSFDGSIDDVRIYDKSLSLAEVEELYSAGKIVDISGNGNHGTPVNSPIYRAAPMRLYKPQILTG